MSTLLGQITGSFPSPTLLERPAGVVTRPRVILTRRREVTRAPPPEAGEHHAVPGRRRGAV